MSPNLEPNVIKGPTEECWVYMDNGRPRVAITGRVEAVAHLIKGAKLTEDEKRRIKLLLEQKTVFVGTELKIVGWWEDLLDIAGKKYGEKFTYDRSIVLVTKA